MIIQLPGIGRSLDSIILEACTSSGIKPWGGPSEDGWSKHSDFLRCPYRYYLKHVRGVGPLVVGDKADYLDIGSCVHLLQAAHYARMLPDERYPGWQANSPTPQVLLEALKVAGLPLAIAFEVERLFDGYEEYWAAETLQPVAVEMAAGVVGTHTSRYDFVFFVEDGVHDGLWIGENKTLSAGTDIEDYRLSGEVLGEMFSWVLSALQDFFGAQVNGVCLNATLKAVKLPHYQRLWMTFPDRLINEYGDDRGSWGLWMQMCEERKVWPRSLYGCKSYNRRCRFWEHCRTRNEAQLVKLEPHNA